MSERKSWKVTTGKRTAELLQREKNFPRRRHSLRIRWPVAGWYASQHMIQRLYILIVIDVLSKHAWAMPLKTKNGKEIAIAKIIRDDRRFARKICKSIWEKNFTVQMCKNSWKNINHYSTYSVMKASVVQWFNRTLKIDIWKQFTHNRNYKWIDWIAAASHVKVYITHENIELLVCDLSMWLPQSSTSF